MNKYLSSAFAAAMVFAATTTFAQGATAAQMGKGHGISNSHSGTASSSTAARTTLAGLPQHSPTSHSYNTPAPGSANRTSDRGYTQGQYTATAVVVPMTLVFRVEERVLRTAAPTKSAAMSRMRQMIDAIGVPVRVVSLEIKAN